MLRSRLQLLFPRHPAFAYQMSPLPFWREGDVKMLPGFFVMP